MEEQDNEVIGLKSILVGYLLHWRLFLGVFLVSFIPAVLYLLIYPRTYEMAARIQIQEDKDLGGGSFGLGEAAGLMKSFGLGSGGGGAVNIEDELMVLTSNHLLREMVFELGVNVDYTKPFWFYRMYEGVPFRLRTDSATDARLAERIEFKVKHSSGKFDVKVEGHTFVDQHFTFSSLPAVMKLPVGDFVLSSTETQSDVKEWVMTYRPSGWVAEDLADEFLIEENSKTSNVIELGCTDYERKRGVDMLNTLMRLYNIQADAYKKGQARTSLSFYDGRIQEVIKDLADVEQKIERYKSQHQLMDIEHDVQFYVEQMKELQTRLIELQAQMNVIDMMDAYVKDPTNKYNIVPSLLNAQDGEKGAAIATYNEVLLERARVIQNSSMNNPLVGTLTKQADELRNGVYQTINNAREGLRISVADIKAKEQQIYNKMNVYPEAERNYVELKRNQEIVQGVYLILLQKREETALVLGQQQDKARILDSAYVKSKPIGPRKLYAAIAMLLLTLVVPVVYLFVREQAGSIMMEFKRQRQK